MKFKLPSPRLGTFLACLLVLASAPASETSGLDPNLQSLQPFVGKTWRGEFKDSTPAKPIIDISKWERALNGKAIRVLHSINDGLYGGESLIHWDAAKKQIIYHYFSTAGFYNVGTMSVSNKVLVAVEKVVGSQEGMTEVRSTYELRSDGTMLNRSQYFKGGEPAGSREVLYKEDPKAAVIFK